MPLILLLALTRQGTLVVETPNYGATISVDRRPIGTAPVEPRVLPVGWHLVEVFARGRPPWARLIFVAPGRTVRLSVRLAPLPPRARRSGRAQGPQPEWQLTGRAMARAALRGADASAALDQRVRLSGSDVLGDATRLVVDLGGESRLAASGRPLLRLIEPTRRSRLRVDAAWVGWKSVRGGRLPLVGPTDVRLVLDGVDAHATWRGWRVSGRAGARGAPVGSRPDDLLAGAGLAHVTGPSTARLDWWFHGEHHVEGRAATVGQRWRVGAATSLIGRRLHRASVDGRWDRVRLGYVVRGPAQSALVDPLRSLGLDPLERVPWHGPELGLSGQAPDWSISGLARLRMSDQGVRFDARVGVERHGAWRPGFTLDGVATEWERPPRAPSLRQRAGARVTLRQRWADASAGLAWQVTDTSRRLLPEGGIRVRLPLADRLDVVAAIALDGVDPVLLPGSGVLWHGQLGVRLR